MPKYTVIIGGKERTIDKDKFDGNAEAIAAKYPDARIKAINGDTEGMLPISNYSKAIERGYKMVEVNDAEPISSPVADSFVVQTMDSVRDYKPAVASGVNKPFNLVKEMNEPTDTQKRETERKRIEEQAAQAKKIADARSLNSKADIVQADYEAVMANPFSLITEPLTGVSVLTEKQIEARKKAELNRATAEKAEDTFNMVEEAKKKGNTSFVAGFGRGFWEKASKVSTWDLGASDLQSNMAVSAAAKKYSEGVPLSQEEDMLLDAVALEAAAQGEFSGDLGRGYKAGGTTAESIPFMAEFMINPATGTGKAIGKAAAKKIITNFGKEAAKSTIGKIARASARVAGDVVGAGIMAGTTGGMRTSADAVDRMTGEVKPTIDADGYYRFGGMKEGDGGVKAFAKAYGASTIENFSEMFGNYLVPVGAAMGELAGRSMKKIGLGKVNDIIGRVKSSDIAKIVDDFQGQTQWNGTIGEYLEEQAGMAMNALTVGDNQFSDLIDVDTQIDTFLGVSAFGGFFSGIKTAGYAREKYGQRKRMNEAEREASGEIGEEWQSLKEAIDGADDAELVSILTSTMSDESLKDKQKQDVLLYAGRLKAYHGANLADLKRKTEGDTPEEVVQAQMNFDAGYKLAEADRREKRKAFKELSGIKSKLDDDFLSAEESVQYDLMRQRADAGGSINNELTYINARSRFDGMIYGIRDVIDEKVAISNQYISRVTHQDGNVYDVTLLGDANKHVYPVSGEIIVDENGIVDRKYSDSRFIVRDENGKVEMRSVEDLYKMESMDNAEMLKDAHAQSIREQESERYADEIEMPGEEEKMEVVGALQSGSEVRLNVGGVAREAVVQNVYSDGSIELRFEDRITGHDGKEKHVEVFTTEEVASFLIPIEEGDMKKGTEDGALVEEISGDIKNDDEKTDISTKIDLSDITVDDYINSNSGFTDFGIQRARENEDVSIGKAKLQAEMSLRYLQGEISAKEMVTSPAYRYNEGISDESAEEYAQKESMYWRDKYANRLQSTATETTTTDPKDISTGDANEVAPEKTMESLLLELPKKKDGAIDYKSMTPRQTFEYTKFSEGDEVAIGDLHADIMDVSEELGKIESKVGKAKGVERIELREQAKVVKSRLSELQTILGEVAPAPTKEESIESERVPMDEDMLEWTADNSNDADELLSAYNQAKEMASHDSKLKPWEQSLLGRKVSTDSFMRFADRNLVTGQLAKGWLSKDATSIDQISKEFEMEGIDVSDQEIVDFIIRNPSNYVRKTSDTQNKLGRRFSEAASKASGMPIGSPESVTGRLFVQNMQQGKTIEGMYQAAQEQALQEDSGREEVFFNAIPDKNDWTDEQVMDSVFDGIEYRDGEYIASDGMTSDEIDEIYSQLELNNDGRETEEANSQEDEFADAFDEAREIEEPGTPGVVAVENREDKERDSGVEGLENTKGYLDIDGSSASLQNTSQLEYNEISESVSPGEFGKVLEEDSGSEEPSYQLRRRTEETSRDAQKGEGSRGNEQEGNRVIETQAKQYADFEKNNLPTTPTREEKETLFDYAKRIDNSQERGEEVVRTPEATNKILSFVSPEIKPNEDVYGYAERVVSSKILYDEQSKVNTDPTDAQKEAGNYKMGHVKIGGHEVTIENPKGSIRKGVGVDGKAWETPMNNVYGYFRGTKGKDGDHIDTFLGDNLGFENVYVVDQVNEDGSFDEHKVMYGFDSVEDARVAYLSNYEDGWQGLGEITGVSRDVFDEWLKGGAKKRKPFAEYKIVREGTESMPKDEQDREQPEEEKFDLKTNDSRFRIPAAFTEKGERVEKLRNNRPIEITGEEITSSDDLKEYKRNALEYGKSLRGEYKNKDTGIKISLGKSGIKEVLNHDFKDIEQLQSIAAIPQIIENSIYIDTIDNLDVEKNADVSKYHYYVSGLKIGGVDYTVRAVVAEQPNGNRFYDHKLTQIEKGELIDSLSGITTPGFNQPTLLPEYKDKKLISILQTNEEKIHGFFI